MQASFDAKLLLAAREIWEYSGVANRGEETMRWSTSVTEKLGISVPVVQAPMGGGPTTAELVSAVSEAGGLGSVAAGYLTPERLREEIIAVRRLTDRPYAVNVFAGPQPTELGVGFEAVLAVLEGLREEVGLPPRPTLTAYAEDAGRQLEVILADPPSAVSFTFGLLERDVTDSLHSRGCALIGTATTVAEAVALERSGVDMVCAQGAEAGAHRGTFLGDPSHAVVGTLALVPQVCDAVSVPVIASGGIMDGRGLAAVLALGAGAAQLGTAFLRCPEAGTAAPYRRALSEARDTSTALTSQVTGRLARGVDNRLMRELAGLPVPPYPVMNALTAELRRVGAARGEPELMSLWCGQGVALGSELPAAELVGAISEAAGLLLERLGCVMS